MFAARLVEAYQLFVVLAVASSWLADPRAAPRRPGLAAFLVQPLLRWIGRRLPVIAGGMDLSPVVLVFALEVVKSVVGSPSL